MALSGMRRSSVGCMRIGWHFCGGGLFLCRARSVTQTECLGECGINGQSALQKPTGVGLFGG